MAAPCCERRTTTFWCERDASAISACALGLCRATCVRLPPPRALGGRKRRPDVAGRSQGTQVLMGASAPLCYFGLAATRAGLEHWVRVQHLCTTALLAFIAACAGAFKMRCVRCARAWRPATACFVC